MLTLETFFDNNFYLAKNPDIAAAIAQGAVSSGLEHFLAFGQFERRDPTALFDTSYYLQTNPDIQTEAQTVSGFSGIQHFINFGQFEGRNPSPEYDDRFYLETNPDIKAAVERDALTGIEHYFKIGQYEGRDATPNLLQKVLGRGRVILGVNGTSPGFSLADAAGNFRGFDVDMGRAIAAALFNNPNAIEFRQVQIENRFATLEGGQVDISSDLMTQNLTLDASFNIDFSPIIFYDGQGIIVQASSGINSLAGLNNRRIGTLSTGTALQTLQEEFKRQKLTFQSVTFPDEDRMYAAYLAGQVDAISSDRSSLSIRRATFPNPNASVILETALSREPLAMAVIESESEWEDAVKWVMNATLRAEELGINSQNVESLAATSADPTIRRFLGVEGTLGSQLGLPNDFARRIIRNVGNYGEIYNRNLGTASPFNLPRGLNNLSIQGGLLSSPPFA